MKHPGPSGRAPAPAETIAELRALLGEAVAVPRETGARLEAFVATLAAWNSRINLIAPGELGRVWTRHIADSVQLLPLMPTGARRLADLGSGAGFPGLVLAILSGIETHLVESDRRKAAFLAEAARLSGALVRVHAVRAEALDPLGADIVTARALAPLPELLPLAHRHLAPGGICLFHKGARAEAELTAAQRGWRMRVERLPSRTDPHATILRLSEVAPVIA